MKFVITGCARSGTKYSAHMLLGAGISCGHEDVFNRWSPSYGVPDDWNDTDLDGDSSFIAAPFAAELAGTGMTVVHQVRPPLDVVNSITGIDWLSKMETPFVEFVFHHAPSVAKTPPGPIRAATYWVEWNRLVESHAHDVWRLHDIDSDDVSALADRAGLDLDPGRVLASQRTTSNQVNHRSRAAFSMNDLGPVKSIVEETAERYGVPLTSTN